VNLDQARAVADAVLYEGYLLYPYRASSGKNRVRWQFGVLGPPGAAAAGIGEESSMSMQCLLDTVPTAEASIVVHVRFLQLQRRQVYDAQGCPVEELTVAGTTSMSWDEVCEQTTALPLRLPELVAGITRPVVVDGGDEVEQLTDEAGANVGRVVRRRWPLVAQLRATAEPVNGYLRLELRVDNVRADPAADKDQAIQTSLIGAHLLVEGHGVRFVSLLEPPDDARPAVAQCTQHRCWPVLAGAVGDTDLVLGSPIILYDYPEIAAESAGALFDATEIDEILTLRVMTMTDQEKAEARATDRRAREIIDRCEEMTPEAMQQLHGILRNPHVEQASPLPWWDPAADAAMRPELDVVTIDGVGVSRGSLVRVHPSRRADAQDLFFADQIARVTAVVSDVDGGVHIALVLVDDPAADLHDWYGRYFYFAPDEVRPLTSEEARQVRGAQVRAERQAAEREESRP